MLLKYFVQDCRAASLVALLEQGQNAVTHRSTLRSRNRGTIEGFTSIE